MGWLVGIAALVGVSVAIGLVSPRRTKRRGAAQEPVADDREALWTSDALARLGTPETVADLVAQDRADELRALGYEGDIPER